MCFRMTKINCRSIWTPVTWHLSVAASCVAVAFCWFVAFWQCLPEVLRSDESSQTLPTPSQTNLEQEPMTKGWLQKLLNLLKLHAGWWKGRTCWKWSEMNYGFQNCMWPQLNVRGFETVCLWLQISGDTCATWKRPKAWLIRVPQNLLFHVIRIGYVALVIMHDQIYKWINV